MRYIGQGTYKDGEGHPVTSGTVNVYLAGTSTPASVYTALTGGTAVNSVTTDSENGSFKFYVDDADYVPTQRFRIILSKTNFISIGYDYIKLFPASSSEVYLENVSGKYLGDLFDGGYDVPIKPSKVFGGTSNTNGHTVPDIADGTFVINNAANVLSGSNTFSGDNTVTGSFNNLKIRGWEGLTAYTNTTNPSYQVDVTGYIIHIHQDTGYATRLIDFGGTVHTADITVSGANGLDTGTEAVSTFYYIYLIYNSTTDTKGALLSTQSYFGNVTMPSGYDYLVRVGAVYNDSGGNFVAFHQRGNEVELLTSSPISIGITQTAIDLTSYIPYAICNKVKGYINMSDTIAGEYYIKIYLINASSMIGEQVIRHYLTSYVEQPFSLLVNGQYIYAYGTSTDRYLYITGYELWD